MSLSSVSVLVGPVPHKEAGAERSSIPNVPAVPKGHTEHALGGKPAEACRGSSHLIEGLIPFEF